jgi:Fe2+ transport system protein FeoA
MQSQPDEGKARHAITTGLQVESKVPVRKLLARMGVQDGEELEVAREFCKNGGIIADIDGHNVLVEVDGGSFTIHRMYIKRQM